MRRYSRSSSITRLANEWLDRHLAEQRNLQSSSLPCTAACSKNIVALAIAGTQEVAHVLHDSEHRNIRLCKHRRGLARVDKRDLLRCRHNHRSRQGDGLHNRQLDVSRAGRKVENKVIEIPPGHLTQKLLRVAGHHRPAKDRWRTIIEQKSHRHQRNPISLDRNDAILIIRCRALASTEHDRHARSINIAIAQARSCSRLGKG